jgi:hypothetical protein
MAINSPGTYPVSPRSPKSPIPNSPAASKSSSHFNFFPPKRPGGPKSPNHYCPKSPRGSKSSTYFNVGPKSPGAPKSPTNFNCARKVLGVRKVLLISTSRPKVLEVLKVQDKNLYLDLKILVVQRVPVSSFSNPRVPWGPGAPVQLFGVQTVTTGRLQLEHGAHVLG